MTTRATPKTAPSRVAQFILYGSLPIAAVIVVLWIWLLGMASDRFLVLLLVTSFVFGGGMTAVISLVTFSWFKERNDARAAALSATFPRSYLLHIVVTPSLHKQLRTAASVLGLPASKVRRNSYATLVSDPQAVRLFGGGRKPKQGIALPTDRLVQVFPGPYTNGVRTLTALNLGFAAEGGVVTLTMVPIDGSGVFVRSVKHADVLEEFPRMQAATHPQQSSGAALS
ncbi:hypothetical protein LWF01_03160 [Saxibacter everestensis]|uniref:DUF502 domain-containing protein n=1 Tax=Saxibacter everestensis TaxID=2909229 RepID=A0ABY8QUU1_9MICO|nr:hypothetical protein LWF01_03160 [Brevibacteriaceae bacterium ZFBP1038]